MTGEAMRDDAVLFRAMWRGNLILVGHATDAELDAIAGPVDPASARDLLHAWSLIRVRDPHGRGIEVHALGWRVNLGNFRITSALVDVDVRARTVSTRFEHACHLEPMDRMELAPTLRDHLAYALRTWEFADVGP